MVFTYDAADWSILANEEALDSAAIHQVAATVLDSCNTTSRALGNYLTERSLAVAACKYILDYLRASLCALHKQMNTRLLLTLSTHKFRAG